MMIDRYSIALFLVFSYLVGLLDASAGDADPRYRFFAYASYKFVYGRKKEIKFPTIRGKLLSCKVLKFQCLLQMACILLRLEGVMHYK
ncbi:hypothetical protein Gotur_022056 [Gossypium turneri]